MRTIIARMPVVFHRRFRGGATIDVATRLWVLDELRWAAQRDPDEAPRALLDTLLGRLNHGDVVVVVGLVEFIAVVKAAIEA